MKKWSKMSHQEKADFWMDIAVISGLLSLFFMSVLIGYALYQIIAAFIAAF